MTLYVVSMLSVPFLTTLLSTFELISHGLPTGKATWSKSVVGFFVCVIP
jgi:hypothetical protein